MTTSTDSLARIVASLKAVPVGTENHYAWQIENGQWLVTTDQRLADFADGYSRHRFAVAMPSWWTPERRTHRRFFTGRLITADLETGAEVPA